MQSRQVNFYTRALSFGVDARTSKCRHMFKIVLLCAMVFVQSLRASEKSAVNDKLTLDLVQVIFRHGERTPINQEAKLFNITDAMSVYETDFGMLTKKGMMQEYKLGQLLRKNYNDHLGKYKENDVVAKTTMTSRTKMSLELVLAGLFSPSPEERWNPDLNWKPIPYEITANTADVVLSPHQNPKFLKLWRTVVETSEYYNEFVSKHTQFLKSMGETMNIPLLDNVLFNVGWTGSFLRIHKSLNMSLPSWCTDEVYGTFEELFIFLFNSMSYSTKMQKFNGGPLIKLVIENIERNKKQNKKICLYSTHDLSLSGFTKAQDIPNAFELPPFGSAYIVENYKDSEQQDYVRILSWDGKSDHFVELEIKDCEKYCPLEKYKNSVKNVIPTEEELKLIEPNSSKSSVLGLYGIGSENIDESCDARNGMKLKSNLDLNMVIVGAIAFTILIVIPAIFVYKKFSSPYRFQTQS